MGLTLKADVALDGSGFEAGIARLEKAGSAAFGRLKEYAVAAFGIAGIEEAVRKTVELADQMADTARRVGVGVEALEELGFAARQNGADIEQLTSFIEKLNSARIDPKKLGAFGKFGIEQADLQTLGAEQLIDRVSRNVRNRNPQEFIGDLRQIGGKGAGALIPTLKEDLEEVRQAARDSGAVMRGETVASLKLIVDEMHLFSQVILVQLAPAIAFAMEQFQSFVRRLQSAGTFWGSFSSNITKKDVLGFLSFVTDPGQWITGPKDKEAAGNIRRAFTNAGAQSLNEVEAGDAAFKKRLALLTSALNSPEHPEFALSDAGGRKEFHPRFTESFDALARVGNFLGTSGRDAVSTVASQQLDYLKKIEYNTRPAAGSVCHFATPARHDKL